MRNFLINNLPDQAVESLIDLKHQLTYRLTDYYFVSYPKSGRTWTRYFLSKYLEEKLGREPSLEFDSIFKSRVEWPRLEYLHAHHRKESLKDMKEFAEMLKRRDKNVVFLARDPRDVLVSLYFQHKKRQKGDPLSKNVDIHEFVRLPRLGAKRLIKYMNFWYENRNEFGDFLLLRYEDLKENPKKHFGRFIDFLQIDRDNEVLSSAVEASSFDNMRKAEKSGKVDNARLKPTNKEDEESYKTRRGVVGGYVDYLDESDIEYINGVMSKLHDDFGYK